MALYEIGWNMALFAVSVGLLVLGSDWLVRGASRLAAAMGISPLVVGLTVVAFGTSAPEFAVSIAAAINGQGDIALGNVVGSNICNILLILGLTAAVLPLAIDRQIVAARRPADGGRHAGGGRHGLRWRGEPSRRSGALHGPGCLPRHAGVDEQPLAPERRRPEPAIARTCPGGAAVCRSMWR